MNHLQKHFSASLIALVALFSASSIAMAANASPLDNFAVLSAAPGQGGAVTLTRSIINGDVGSSGLPASVVQTKTTIYGSIIAPVSASVVNEFTTALAAGLALPCDNSNALTVPPATGTLAGVTLSPGVYCISSEAKTGILTLSGSGPWTFVVGGGALTGTNFSVVMADGTVPPCDSVTWYVAAATTMTTSNFAGTVYAGAGITITGGTFNGDALAAAAVTTTDATVTSCNGPGARLHCNQGVGNGSESCDPGNSNQGNPFNSNDELGGVPGDPGRQGGNKKITTNN